MPTLRYLSQLLTAGIFILGGMQAYRDPAPRAAKARVLGMPESQQGVRINGAVMVAGGIALALDLFPRTAAALLAASLVPTTIIGHAFWTEQNPATRQAQQTQFLKNLAMLAALLLLIQPPGERQQPAA